MIDKITELALAGKPFSVFSQHTTNGFGLADVDFISATYTVKTPNQVIDFDASSQPEVVIEGEPNSMWLLVKKINDTECENQMTDGVQFMLTPKNQKIFTCGQFRVTTGDWLPLSSFLQEETITLLKNAGVDIEQKAGRILTLSSENVSLEPGAKIQRPGEKNVQYKPSGVIRWMNGSALVDVCSLKQVEESVIVNCTGNVGGILCVSIEVLGSKSAPKCSTQGQIEITGMISQIPYDVEEITLNISYGANTGSGTVMLEVIETEPDIVTIPSSGYEETATETETDTEVTTTTNNEPTEEYCVVDSGTDTYSEVYTSTETNFVTDTTGNNFAFAAAAIDPILDGPEIQISDESKVSVSVETINRIVRKDTYNAENKSYFVFKVKPKRPLARAVKVPIHFKLQTSAYPGENADFHYRYNEKDYFVQPPVVEVTVHCDTVEARVEIVPNFKIEEYRDEQADAIVGIKIEEFYETPGSTIAAYEIESPFLINDYLPDYIHIHEYIRIVWMPKKIDVYFHPCEGDFFGHAIPAFSEDIPETDLCVKVMVPEWDFPAFDLELEQNAFKGTKIICGEDYDITGEPAATVSQNCVVPAPPGADLEVRDFTPYELASTGKHSIRITPNGGGGTKRLIFHGKFSEKFSRPFNSRIYSLNQSKFVPSAEVADYEIRLGQLEFKMSTAPEISLGSSFTKFILGINADQQYGDAVLKLNFDSIVPKSPIDIEPVNWPVPVSVMLSVSDTSGKPCGTYYKLNTINGPSCESEIWISSDEDFLFVPTIKTDDPTHQEIKKGNIERFIGKITVTLPTDSPWNIGYFIRFPKEEFDLYHGDIYFDAVLDIFNNPIPIDP